MRKSTSRNEYVDPSNSLELLTGTMPEYDQMVDHNVGVTKEYPGNKTKGSCDFEILHHLSDVEHDYKDKGILRGDISQE